MTINKIFFILLFLVALWFAGFWVGKECYLYNGTCYAPIVKEVFDQK